MNAATHAMVRPGSWGGSRWNFLQEGKHWTIREAINQKNLLLFGKTSNCPNCLFLVILPTKGKQSSSKCWNSVPLPLGTAEAQWQINSFKQQNIFFIWKNRPSDEDFKRLVSVGSVKLHYRFYQFYEIFMPISNLFFLSSYFFNLFYSLGFQIKL